MIALAVLTAPALAETCPQPLDYTAELKPLLDGLQTATSEAEARPFTAQMWTVKGGIRFATGVNQDAPLSGVIDAFIPRSALLCRQSRLVCSMSAAFTVS